MLGEHVSECSRQGNLTPRSRRLRGPDDQLALDLGQLLDNGQRSTQQVQASFPQRSQLTERSTGVGSCRYQGCIARIDCIKRRFALIRLVAAARRSWSSIVSSNASRV